MFKILVIKTLNNLSDERTEYLINDRQSFMRFLRLALSDRVPDAKDATLAAAAKQRNTNGEKADLREGRIPEGWEDKPAKLSHKDRHARWTLLSTDLAIPFFGYKAHVSIDRKFRLIRKWKATDAAASDGARLREGLLDGSNKASDVWADTAYRSKANEDFMEKHDFVSKVHRKKPHLNPRPRHIQRSSAGKSVIRSRVKHVFADQKAQTGLFIRTVGITRATMRIGLANIVYNMRRFLFLERISAVVWHART